MGGGQVANLKELRSGRQMCSGITYCKDTYASQLQRTDAQVLGAQSSLKTDASGDGPQKNAPAIVDAGMMGDRADLIFADPSEISSFIASKMLRFTMRFVAIAGMAIATLIS